MTTAHDVRDRAALRRDAWRAYFETTALLTAEIERHLKADSGLDIGDFNILLVLSEAPGERLRLRDLARAVAFGPNRLTYRLDALERRGWVRRERCPDDRRGLEAVLTPAGHRAIRAARPQHARRVNELLLDHLDDDQARTLLEIFAPLRARLTSDRPGEPAPAR
ncbi:MAG TPA: MarR family transcriptional regulator [Actinotalea caeni]|uniref:MarR family winged helix-turn-helix transcriptional regulator n=1 Tax=Actinotalea caeni TaxID=1348467 RepID=UPI002B4B6AE8|nr:MarR family transcriptional regulator [Actinotalea caeni]HLV55601.1 MarR family transcriptional regulator [Actinotalea caeni]